MFPDSAFWVGEEARLRQALADVILDIYLSGSESGLGQLPPALRVLFNPDLFNEAAVQFLNTYSFEWINGISATTADQTRRVIDSWIRSGNDFETLVKTLEPIFGERRARTIAATEATRVFASGNLEAWRATGVVTGKLWRTAVDERVCPICGPLHDTLVELDGGWTFSQEMLDANPELARALSGPQTIMQPPAHVSCRCWLQPVVFTALEPDEIEAKTFK